jgi:hypothetical protein
VPGTPDDSIISIRLVADQVSKSDSCSQAMIHHSHESVSCWQRTTGIVGELVEDWTVNKTKCFLESEPACNFGYVYETDVGSDPIMVDRIF